MEEFSYHCPVLLKESIDALITDRDGVYVDLTFGGGGHSREILSRLSDTGKLFSFDLDPDAKNNIWDDPRLHFFGVNFSDFRAILLMHGVDKVDGILGDFGVSSHQFDVPEKGFSTRFSGPLDMRMNNKSGKTAADILNTYEEVELADLFYQYGELRDARKIARILVKNRPAILENSDELKDLFHFIPVHKKNKYFAQIFQALRIAVNDELTSIDKMLESAFHMLKPNGRLVCISYHSLEDRKIKQFLRNGMSKSEPQPDIYGNISRPFRLLKSGAIIPTDEEIERNPRARSAKMRVGIKL